MTTGVGEGVAVTVGAGVGTGVCLGVGDGEVVAEGVAAVVGVGVTTGVGVALVLTPAGQALAAQTVASISSATRVMTSFFIGAPAFLS